jgi:hypothetical protein
MNCENEKTNQAETSKGHGENAGKGVCPHPHGAAAQSEAMKGQEGGHEHAGRWKDQSGGKFHRQTV